MDEPRANDTVVELEFGPVKLADPKYKGVSTVSKWRVMAATVPRPYN